MSDEESNELVQSSGSAQSDLVTSAKVNRILLTRTIGTEEQEDSRLQREQDFLELQRILVAPIVGRESAQSVVDYYEAGLPEGGFEAILSGKTLVEDTFVMERILGDRLFGELERVYVDFPLDGQYSDERSRDLYPKFIGDFNPDLLYAAFIYPATCEKEGEVHNLFFLRKDVLRPGERSELVRRANELLNILGYSKEFYHFRNFVDPWSGLVHKIQEVSLRAEPMQDVDYARIGRVVRWGSQDLLTGMVVETEGLEQPVILENGNNKEKFGHLYGRLVRYHLKRDRFDVPSGNLVATSLSIPTDDTLRLPILE